jgi:uncharacterized membrane protein
MSNDVETIEKGDGSRVVEARRFVVRDSQSFAAIWSAHAGPDAELPPIDFDRRMVVAVFAGQRPTPGFDVDIAGARREGDVLVVVVNETQPDPGLVAAQVIVSPFHVVSIPRDDGEVRFNTPDPTGQGTIVFRAPKARALPAGGLSGPKASIEPAAERNTTPDAKPDSSSTGLTPEMAASMAYLAGPFSGAILLATERTSPFVRFHAWQALIALGVLGIAAVLCLVLAFALLIVSPTAFWAMVWLAAITGAAWVAVWGTCLVQAYKGNRWKLPLAGDVAERRVTSLRASAVP